MCSCTENSQMKPTSSLCIHVGFSDKQPPYSSLLLLYSSLLLPYSLLPPPLPPSSNVELYREFADEAYSIALHPSGLYILVGFSDKLRLMNLLIDDIRTFKEFPIRGCREVPPISSVPSFTFEKPSRFNMTNYFSL